MAWYRDEAFVHQVDEDEDYDRVLDPGATTTLPGIYRCAGCGREVIARADERLPGETHHFCPEEGVVPGWQLLVFADRRRKVRA